MWTALTPVLPLQLYHQQQMTKPKHARQSIRPATLLAWRHGTRNKSDCWSAVEIAGEKEVRKMANASKTVIVTGGSQGIGAGIARAFLDRGYNVVATSRNVTKSKELP